ncbi:hypothetical protein H4R19_003779, partial [Coemansia spiralis]
AFVNLAIAETDDAGARSIVFGAGLGGMRPNIVVLGALDASCGHAVRAPAARGDALPTDGMRLNEAVSRTAYVRIIEDLMAMGKAVGVAYGFGGLRFPAPTAAAAAEDAGPQYIDLWPIQIGTAAGMTGAASGMYLTNFDSYVMVLQLGTVLHLVPNWGRRYTLRVMCFVEDAADVAEEYRRVAKLLRDLRVDAELRVHALRGAGLATYDRTASSSPLPAPVGTSTAQPIHPGPRTPSKSGAFSMMVNLPMPPRYEATRRASARGIGSTATSSSISSISVESTLDSDPDTSSSSDEDGGLPRSRTLGERVRLGARAAHGAVHRRRSDGAMVLPHFFSRARAGSAAEDNKQQPPPSARGNEELPAADGAEFNDMSAQTQYSVLNELIRRHSSATTTALVFTTLQAPEPGASDSEQRAKEYLDGIDVLVGGLPPVFLVHATSLTVTTSL